MRTRWSMLGGLLLALAASACAPLRVQGLAPQTALAPAQRGPIAERVGELGLAPGQSSFRLLRSNADALALKLRTARLAARSLDLQYYMWQNDASGRLLAAELLRAADRGARVRVLLDDTYVRTLDAQLMALDAHPNLELRVYNPYRTRSSRIGNVLEFVFTGFRPNHRMHNKAWIADGQVAIVGGRNIGDEYFGLHEGFNFRDLGVLMTGAVVAEAEADFDRYWNSPMVLPLAALPPRADSPTLAAAQSTLEDERDQTLASEALRQVLARPGLRADLQDQGQTLVGDAIHVISDPPDKWLQRGDQLLGVAQALRQLIDSAEHEVVLVSPYFVPGRRGLRWLQALEARGVRVRVLTNCLNATDVAAVHGGYARYRRALLRAGVEIHELKRSSALPLESSFRGSSRASLHTKAVIVDGRAAFVGSFNLDSRSTWINTEMGVLIDSAAFAAQVRADYLANLTPERSYRLSLEGTRLVWTDVQNGQPRRQYREPTSSWSRRIIALLARVLPVERHL